MLIVFEGQLRLHADGNIHIFKERDSIWFPAGTKLLYEAQHALTHHAIPSR